MENRLTQFLRSYTNLHIKGSSENVFIFSTPRSGSTWLMELIWTQKGFKYCNEPLDLRNKLLRSKLGFDSWNQLYEEN